MISLQRSEFFLYKIPAMLQANMAALNNSYRMA